MEQRRLGRLGQMDSVLVFGGAALRAVSQQQADRSIELALEAGVNHFDTAPAYGDSELRLAPWMPRIRADIFLSTKTRDRDREAAKRSIQSSLERLDVDRLDLLQLHGIGSDETLDEVTRPGGALEAAIEARDEGLIGGIGITGHGDGAPATHLEGLRRFPFDTVLTPWSFVLSRNEAYRADFEALVEEVERQDSGLMIIKTIARRNWTEGEGRYATWYEPFDRQQPIDAAVAFVLANPAVTSLAMAGDVGLMPMLIEAERNRHALTDADVERILSGDGGYSSPFVAPPDWLSV